MEAFIPFPLIIARSLPTPRIVVFPPARISKSPLTAAFSPALTADCLNFLPSPTLRKLLLHRAIKIADFMLETPIFKYGVPLSPFPLPLLHAANLTDWH